MPKVPVKRSKQTKKTVANYPKTKVGSNKATDAERLYRIALNAPLAAGCVKIPFFQSVHSTLARYHKRKSFTVPNDDTNNGTFIKFEPKNFNNVGGQSQIVSQYKILTSNNKVDASSKTSLLKDFSLDGIAESVRIVGATMTVDYIGKWQDYSGYMIYWTSPGIAAEFPINDTEITKLYKDDRTRSAKIADMPITMKYKPVSFQDINFAVTTGDKSEWEGGVAFQGTTSGVSMMVQVEVLLEYIPAYDIGFYVPGYPGMKECSAEKIGRLIDAEDTVLMGQQVLNWRQYADDVYGQRRQTTMEQQGESGFWDYFTGLGGAGGASL